VLTADAVAVKPALVAPAAIVTDAGTATALLLLARFTVVAAVAAAVSVTVQAVVPAPVTDPLLQVSALSVGVTGACPVPLKLMVAVEALLPIVTDPLNETAVVGSKLRVSTADWPGFSVRGKPSAVSPKDAPVTEALLMTSAAVPEDVRVTVFVVVVFSATVPKATLVALTVIPGVVVVPAGLSFTAKVFDTLPDFAVIVTVCTELTVATGAVNVPLL
jgi:hypothetical protein